MVKVPYTLLLLPEKLEKLAGWVKGRGGVSGGSRGGERDSRL
jgi:hypothetical protein